MADLLQRGQAGELRLDEMTDQLFEEEIVDDMYGNRRRCTAGHLVGKPQGQLVEGQEMNIQERKASFQSQETLEPIEQGSGGDEHRNRSEWIRSLGSLKMLNERGFEMGMKRTGDDLQHERMEASGAVWLPDFPSVD